MELEQEVGVRSTFYVLVDGRPYNPLQRDITVVSYVRSHSLGHEIGLHFALSSAVGPDIGQRGGVPLEVLSALAGVEVRSFSPA